jgi:hypothetical protein
MQDNEIIKLVKEVPNHRVKKKNWQETSCSSSIGLVCKISTSGLTELGWNIGLKIWVGLTRLDKIGQ